MSELPARPQGRIVRREEAGQWLDGYAFLDAARQEAERIHDSLRQCQADARAEGFEEGLREGRQRMAEALARQHAQQGQWLASLEPALADLALGIARAVIGELDDHRRLLALTHTAVGSFRQGQALVLHVPGAEVDSVRQRLAGEGLRLTVEADEVLQPGQARLASPQGSVDLGVEEQLQQLRHALLPLASEGASS